MAKQNKDKKTQKQNRSSSRKEKLSHADKNLDSDYRPTSQGSTDYDRNKKTKGQSTFSHLDQKSDVSFKGH